MKIGRDITEYQHIYESYMRLRDTKKQVEFVWVKGAYGSEQKGRKEQ